MSAASEFVYISQIRLKFYVVLGRKRSFAFLRALIVVLVKILVYMSSCFSQCFPIHAYDFTHSFSLGAESAANTHTHRYLNSTRRKRREQEWFNRNDWIRCPRRDAEECRRKKAIMIAYSQSWCAHNNVYGDVCEHIETDKNLTI